MYTHPHDGIRGQVTEVPELTSNGSDLFFDITRGLRRTKGGLQVFQRLAEAQN